MAHHKSAIKRIRSSERRRDRNRQDRRKLRTLIKAVRTAQDKETAEKALVRAVSELDKAVNKNLIHRNRAANQKSKLVRFVQKM